MTGNVNIQDYAREQISSRLGRLVFQVHATAKRPDEEAVHDLRVTIRRFGQSLAVFESLLPAAASKQVRKRLKRTMDLAGDIRDRDIALEFLKNAGVSESDRLWRKLVADRDAAEKRLLRQVSKWSEKNVTSDWRTMLGVGVE